MVTRLQRSRAGLAALVALGLLGGSSAAAQVRVSTVEELQRTLSPGDDVLVVRTEGGAIEGRLLRIGTAGLEIHGEVEEAGQPRRRRDITIPFSALQSLERRRDSSRNGALIGAGVGAAITGAMFISAVAIDRNEIDEWAPIYMGYGAMFSGMGALVGWAVDSGRSKPIRFDRPSAGALEVRVAPVLSRRPGVVVMISF
jgi:hypothetical protein